MLNAILGNVSKVENNLLNQEFAWLLCKDEEFKLGYILIRDMFIFTDKRLVLVDKQGLTGKKVEVLSIPYREITKFSTENAGTFDLDSELKIWVKGESVPISKKFKKSINIQEVYQFLSEMVL
jgi:hypothetical protein